MPVRTIRCSICGAKISGYDFPERMSKLRRHYKSAHPGKFREMVARALKTKKRKKNPSFPLFIATLGNPPIDTARFPGYRSGLSKFRQSHGSSAEINSEVADIPGIEAGTTWVLQGVEESVVYRSDIIAGSSKGKSPYEHNVGENTPIKVKKKRYYSADYHGVELVLTFNMETGQLINAYKNGWMDES